ncbi:MAG: aldo/keto reductase [Acidobacteria bacterium]|nr:aldo/keto reductase [Acidobacteriota bacterium]
MSVVPNNLPSVESTGPVIDSFQETIFGSLQRKVLRLGFSASYRPGVETVRRALDAGVQVFFAYGFDSQMIRVLREITPSRRQELVYVTGAYQLLGRHPNLRRTLEKRLRHLGTDYIDCFLFLGVMSERGMLAGVLEELQRFREEGKVLAIGVSIHDRKLAGDLAARGAIQTLMMRYNAAHRGAEQDIFPRLAAHGPGVIGYTATRWTALLRHPRGWPKDGRVPTPGMCYRFVLSNPHVHICLTAPRNLREFEENLSAFREGLLDPADMAFMRDFGVAVHAQRRWFM